MSCNAGEPLLTPETIAHVAAVVREKGTDAWWLADMTELLPEALRDQAEQYRRGDDTMVRAGILFPPLVHCHCGLPTQRCHGDQGLDGTV